MREIMTLCEGRSTPDGLDIQEGPGWDGPTLEHPAVLYHASSSANRNSILCHGLSNAFTDGAGIFFTDTLAAGRNGIDIWQVDLAGLPLERDTTTDHHHLGEEWWVSYDLPEIEPARLRLVTFDKEKT